MPEGTFLSWDEVQRLALPPDATMLVPPPPEPAEVSQTAAGPPPSADWLDDQFVADTTAATVEPQHSDAPPDSATTENASRRHGPMRVIDNLLVINALLDWARTPAKAKEEKKSLPPEPKPDKP